MFAAAGQQPAQLPISAARRKLKAILLRNSGRSLLTAPRSLEFAWDPSTNPEQARLKRAAIVAGGVVAGGLGLALLGKRRGWFNAPVARPRLQLTNLHPSADPLARAPAPALTPPSAPPAPRSPFSTPTRQARKAKMAAIVSGIQKANAPVVHAPVVANPAAKAKLSEVLKGLNKGQSPAPTVMAKGSVERILRPSGPSGTHASAPNPSVSPARRSPLAAPSPKKIPPDLARKPNKVFRSRQDEWLEDHPESVTAKKVKAATVKRTTKASAKATERGAVEEKIAHTENAMRHLPEHVRHAISRLHEQVRVNPTKGGREVAAATLDRVLSKHGLKKSSLGKNAEMRSALDKFDKNLSARARLVEFARGDPTRKFLWKFMPRFWKGKVPALPRRGTEESSILSRDLRQAWRNKGNIYGDLHSNWARQGIMNGVATGKVKGATRTWVEPGTGLEARIEATEFFADRLRKILPKAGMAAVEMLPGGTAINAAGLAGIRTGVHLRRILRARYGGLTNAALQIQPFDAAGIMGEAAGTGVRDSRAFLRKTVRTLPRPVSRALNKKVFSVPIDTGTYLMRNEERPERGVDRWMRRAAYAAAPVAAAGSIAVLLKARKLVPSAQRTIDEWHSVARKAGDAVSQVQSVAEQASRSRFLPKARAPGDLARGLARSPQFSGNSNTGFMARLRNKLLGAPGPGMKLFSVPRDVRFLATTYPLPAITFACSPEENLYLRERLRKQREQMRLRRSAVLSSWPKGANQRVFHFGGYGPGGQLRDIDDNTYANPAAAAMGTQKVYTHKDREGNPVPMDVTLRHAQVGRYVWNRAARAERPLRRGYGMARDVKDVVAGNPRRVDSRGRPRPREWEKAWFKRTLGIAGAAAAGMGGLAYLKHFPHQGPKIPFTNKRAPSRDAVMGKYEGLKERVNAITPDFFPRRQQGFAARLRAVLLDYTSGDWDVRDARGRSARVFAGGSNPRDRRPKYWWEKARNQRIMAAVGIAGAASAGFAGGKLIKDRPLSDLVPFRFRNPWGLRKNSVGPKISTLPKLPPGAGLLPVRMSAPRSFREVLLDYATAEP